MHRRPLNLDNEGQRVGDRGNIISQGADQLHSYSLKIITHGSDELHYRGGHEDIRL